MERSRVCLACTSRERVWRFGGRSLSTPKATLLSSEVSFFNVGRNIDELMRKFKANLYVARKQAEACPAQWKDDGDKTLTPGPKLVGKVHEALTK